MLLLEWSDVYENETANLTNRYRHLFTFWKCLAMVEDFMILKYQHTANLRGVAYTLQQDFKRNLLCERILNTILSRVAA